MRCQCYNKKKKHLVDTRKFKFLLVPANGGDTFLSPSGKDCNSAIPDGHSCTLVHSDVQQGEVRLQDFNA